MHDISHHTGCIHFVSRHSEDDYVQISGSSSYHSDVGRQDGVTHMYINQNDVIHGRIMHELLHVLGFIHEHTRPDRDNYVTIHWENVLGGEYNPNFIKASSSETVILGHYDYESIMHYSAYGSTIHRGKATITPKHHVSNMGQRDHLTSLDIAKIRKYYDC